MHAQIGPIQPNPWNIEHLPSAERVQRVIPRRRAGAKLDAMVIQVVSLRHRASRRAHLRVGKFRLTLLLDEISNDSTRWCGQEEHRWILRHQRAEKVATDVSPG